MVAMPQARGAPGKTCRRPKAVQLELPAPCAKTRAASREQTACMAAARGCYPRDSFSPRKIMKQSLSRCCRVVTCVCVHRWHRPQHLQHRAHLVCAVTVDRRDDARRRKIAHARAQLVEGGVLRVGNLSWG